MWYFRILIFLLVILVGNEIYGKDKKYPVKDIPKPLLENAKAVLRDYTTEITIKSDKDYQIKKKYVITVLNENAIENTLFTLMYDKFTKVKDITAIVYNETGDYVKKLRKDEIEDYSAFSSYTLFSDNRVKYVDPEYRKIPFTFEISYEEKNIGTLSFPTWSPYIDFNISVEKSEFKVTVPRGYKFRYLENNINDKVKTGGDEVTDQYYWGFSSLKALKYEDHSVDFEKVAPFVVTAPSDFEIEGYKGNFETWQNFGKWIAQLNQDRNNLSDETKAAIIDLVKDVKDEKEKIKVLYEYMQNKTRYVSIQIGIGGWQPFDAKTVDEYSYGDCKALSNYMKTILEVAGINSYYTLIYAGEDIPVSYAGFPYNMFNHAILCVPLKNDTVWLECTDQFHPFGYQSTFTDDREALLITDEGGVIAKTKALTFNENKLITYSKVNYNGALSEAKIDVKNYGMYYDNTNYFQLKDKTGQNRIMESYFKIPNYKVVNYNFTNNKSRIPQFLKNADLHISNLGTNLQDKILIPLNLLRNSGFNMPQTFNREYDIQIDRPVQLIDTVVYIIPDKYKVLQVPDNLTLVNKFGEFAIEIVNSGNQIIYVRKQKANKGTFSVNEYETMKEYYLQINKADNLKFVIQQVKL